MYRLRDQPSTDTKGCLLSLLAFLFFCFPPPQLSSRPSLAFARFSCVVCESFDLCESCYRRGCHPEHPFAKQSHPGGQWETVERDDYPKVEDTESGMAYQEQGEKGGKGGASVDTIVSIGLLTISSSWNLYLVQVLN